MNNRRVILIVEDTEEDVELLKLAIRKANVTTPIQVARDGQEALDYLSGAGKFADRAAHPFPGVLFLDLKLPRRTGFDVLQFLKEYEQCKLIPVMVLTSSGLEQDVIRAYQLGANCYMVKPGTLGELLAFVEVAFRFWGMCALPPVPERC